MVVYIVFNQTDDDDLCCKYFLLQFTTENIFMAGLEIIIDLVQLQLQL